MNARRAMTLVEVLGALAILVVLSAGVIGFFLQVNERRDQLVRLSAQQRDVALFFDRLETGVMAALTVAPDGSAGVSGGPTSLTLASRLVNPPLPGDGAAADATKLEFVFNESAARCVCTLAAYGIGGEQLSEPMIEHVERIRFRYADGRSWGSSFDSASSGRLPVAIEVSIWLEPRSGPREMSEAPPAPSPDDAFVDPDAELFGPLDIPLPEPEVPGWIPREPDHVRVILVPDAPGAGWGGGPA